MFMALRKIQILGVSALAGLASVFSSCSDSEPIATDTTICVDPTYTSKGIETEVKSAILEVPVTSNGKWIAVVDSCDWLTVLDNGQPIHNGNGTVTLQVDENRTQVGRKNTLTILDFNDNVIEIPVYQTTTYYGKPLSNGGTANWFDNNGVGSAVNYEYFMQPDSTRGQKSKSFDPVKVPKYETLFNFATLETKNTLGTADAKLYTNTPVKLADLNAVELVNSIAQDKSLDGRIEMGCSFGFIEFQAEGTYSSTMSDSSSYVNYSICKQAPVLNSNLQVGNIATLAQDIVNKYNNSKDFQEKLDSLYEEYEKATTARKKDLWKRKIEDISACDFGGYFSKSFANSYWKIYNLVKNAQYLYTDTNEYKKKLNAELASLDSKFGPYFISGGQFGGAFNMYAKIDKKNITDATKFSAEISANISDKFNLSGKIEFTSTGKQLCKNSQQEMNVYGGNAAETLSAIKAFLQTDMTNGTKLGEILTDWGASFSKTETNPDGTVEPTNAAPISFTITPIWNLFDSELLPIIKNYFMNAYADKGIATWSKFTSSESLGTVEDLLKTLAQKNTTTDSTTDSKTDSKK